MAESYIVLGLMSGTSLDGLDMALCRFEQVAADRWKYEIMQVQTVQYSRELQRLLRQAPRMSAFEFVRLHKNYAKFIAEKVNEFLRDKQRPLLIASHGHTVFHYPHIGLNFQLGDGAVIAELTSLPVVCDFRSNDIALGGQGAPLVPMAERYLFHEYDMLLNLGGFSNITVLSQDMAFDISPVNYALNYYSRILGQDFDKDGTIGRQGKVDRRLLEQLNSLEYYSSLPPKSLSAHWFFDTFLPVVERFRDLSVYDKMATLYEHISEQIANVLGQYKGRVLVTGGGAKNTYLMNLLREKAAAEIVLPEQTLIDYKEAMAFGFLGLLRWLGKKYCKGGYTGAKDDSTCGAIYLP